MEHPDQRYIDALRENNVILIDEIYKKYSGKITRMVLQNNGNESNAEDVFQDVLLSIYRRAKDGNFILSCPLEGFLYLACKNTWLNELNKKSHKVTIGYSDVYSPGEDSFQMAEQFNLEQDRKSLLAQKLAELCEDCRKLLQLSWSGKPMEEVARILNITYGYARKKKSVCMAELVALVKGSPQFKMLKV
jgi:RNA polymerase sigma factor (sigma-70 family)